jgi:MFS family permease
MIALMLVVASAFSEGVRPANVTSTSLYVPNELRARSFALNRLAVNLGIAVGPAIGGFLAAFQYSLIFWGEAVTCVCAAIAMYFFFRNTKPRIYDDVPATHVQTDKDHKPYHNKPFLLFIMLNLPITLGFFQIFVTMPLFLEDHYGMSAAGFGLVMAVNGLTIALFEMVLIHRTEHVSPLRLAAIGSFLMCGGLGLMPMSTMIWFPFFATLIFTIGEMLNMPASMSQISLWAPASQRGRYVAFYSAIWGLSFILGPVLGTWVYKHYGAFMLWGGIGVIGGLAAAGMWLLSISEDRRIAKLKLQNAE